MSPPLYQQTLALCAVLCDELGGDEGQPFVRDRVLGLGCRLQCALAVAGIDRVVRLRDADATLCTLRAELDLARLIGLIPDEVHLALAEHTEGIGRQLGGWLRSLQVDRSAPPVRDARPAPKTPRAAPPGNPR